MTPPRFLTQTAVTVVAVLLLGGCMTPTSHIADYQTETEHLATTLEELLPASQEISQRRGVVSRMGVEPNESAQNKPTDIVWWGWDDRIYFGDDQDAPRQAVEPLDTYLLDNNWTKNPAPNSDPSMADAFAYRKNDERGGNWYIKLSNTTPDNSDYVPLLDIQIVSPTTQRGDFTQ